VPHTNSNENFSGRYFIIKMPFFLIMHFADKKKRNTSCLENGSDPIGALDSLCSAEKAGSEDNFKGCFRKDERCLIHQVDARTESISGTPVE
jgi:hypothetical protein